MSSRALALFDFDGTITYHDSLLSFIRFVKGPVRLGLGLLFLSPVLIGFRIGIIANWRAKQILFTHFFKGMARPEFQRMCEQFSHEIVPGMIRPKATERIYQHLAQGDRVVVVSASPEDWVGIWAKSNGLEWISTRLQCNEGKLTGKISGKNCHGEEKVVRIKSYLNLTEFTEIHTYGDSPGDLPMVNLGTVKHYKPFRD